MLTRKDYKAIASIIKERVEASTSCLISPAMLCKKLADYFAQDNPRFARRKFLLAAGVAGPDPTDGVAGPDPTEYHECGSCGSYHRADFSGDCRNDAERFSYEDLVRMRVPAGHVIGLDIEAKPKYNVFDPLPTPCEYQWTEEDGPMPKYFVKHMDGDYVVHVGFADSLEEVAQLTGSLSSGDHWSQAVYDLETMQLVKVDDVSDDHECGLTITCPHCGETVVLTGIVPGDCPHCNRLI